MLLSPSKQLVLSQSKISESTIYTLKSIHFDLMRCVRLANRIFGFQTMLCIGITFLFTIFTLFVSYKAFFYEDKLINVSISSIYWCCFYNCFYFTVVTVCNLLDSENLLLSSQISKLVNRNVCRSTIIEAFGNQVRQISSKSSCGLFNFDYSLFTLVSFLLTSMTKIVIID